MENELNILLNDILQKENLKTNEWNAMHTIINFIKFQVLLFNILE